MRYDHSLLCGILGGLVATRMLGACEHPAEEQAGRRLLGYSRGFRILAALMLPGAAFVAYAAYHARADQATIAALVAGGFALVAAWLGYEAFLVQVSYDDDYFYYRSPVRGVVALRWRDGVEIRYHRLWHTFSVRADGVRAVECSAMRTGIGDWLRFLNRKAEE